jgi:hypothetical protein
MNSTMPMTPSAVVMRTVRVRPRRSTTGPAKIRVSASPGGERGEEQRGDRGALPMIGVHRQGEPAVGRAFAELDAEHDHADEQQPPVQPAAQPLAQPGRAVAGRPVGGRVVAGRYGRRPGPPRGGRHDDHRLADELRRRADARAAQAAPIPEPTAAPTDQAACIIGIRVRPATRSTAAPSTLISTSRVPIPVPAITKPKATSGSEPTMSATPITSSRRR